MYVGISFRSLMPSWEEVLLFNEIFSYFLSREETDPKVIMFFEVKNSLSFNCASYHFGVLIRRMEPFLLLRPVGFDSKITVETCMIDRTHQS